MRRVALTGARHDLRARRWDVLVLGSALPGLVAAVRLGMAGLRVAVVEEDLVAEDSALLREPFSLTAGRKGGVVHECLQALGLPLIERRSLEPEEIALQVLLPDCRLDVGKPALLMDELVAWGLAKPEVARAWVDAVASASDAEVETLLRAPLLRRGARRALPRSGTGRRPRAPAGAATPPGLAAIAEAQLRALSHVAQGELPAAAQARLLGAGLEGGAGFRAPGQSLRGLLRRRIEALHGEFRSLGPDFELIEIGGHPGLGLRRHGEAWLGRALLLNAPEGCLARHLRSLEHAVPPFLKEPAPTRRWAALQLRCPTEALPEALARRAILVDAEPAAALRLVRHPSLHDARSTELVLSCVIDDTPEALAAAEPSLRNELRRLLPFSEGRLVRIAMAPRARWDDELALAAPRAGAGWPGEIDIRRSGRPPVFALPRAEVACLGIEGDLLLGWRAGDALAGDLG